MSNQPSRVETRGVNQRIKLIMDRRQLSTRDLGRLLGVRHTTVVQWFSRDSAPMALALYRLPKALKVNGHWLLTGRGPQTPP